MNRYFAALIFFSFVSVAVGQQELQESEFFRMTETDSLYLLALKKFITVIDSANTGNSEKDYSKTLYLEYKDYLMKIPDLVDGYKIQSIGLKNRRRLFRKNGGRLTLVRMSPLTLDDGYFEITITPTPAKLKGKKHLYLTFGSWTSVIFEFKNGSLHYLRTKNGGI